MSPTRAVTEADVRRAAREGRALTVPPGTVVTPAARDLARTLGLALEEAGRTDAQTHRRTVALGADHGGYPLKEQLKATLAELGYEALDLGTHDTAAVDYPDYAVAVARAVAEGRAGRGIMIDGAGIGSAMAANKVRGVRAALCYDLTTARNAREHNDANVLTLGGKLIQAETAREIVRIFLEVKCTEPRHQRRVAKIMQVEKRYLRR